MIAEALDWLAGSLDKPGRAVRGVLGGKPHEALAAIPFSDSLGITDPNDAVSGRQLTNRFGITGRHDTGWGSWGAGLAADTISDPTNFIPGKKLTAALAGGLIGGGALSRALKLGMKPAHYMAMASDEATPLGRLHALAKRTGTDVWPGNLDDLKGANHEFMNHQIRSVTQGPKALAMWSPRSGQRGMIVPNTLDHPELWADQGQMNNLAQQNRNWFSTSSPEHVSLHEIGHSLHRDLGTAMREWRPDEVGAHHLIPRQLGRYSATNPLEYVAEMFARKSVDGDEPAMQHLSSLYERLAGPNVPQQLIDKLREYR